MKSGLLTGLLLLWVSAATASATLKPFVSASLQQIITSRQGAPFILVLWSIDCPPCLQELARLQQLRTQFHATSLVLVSTDEMQMADEVAQLLSDFELDQMDSWIFAESIPERLRYAIDPAWYGELPRAYFYSSGDQRIAHSGSLNYAVLQQWLQQNQLNANASGAIK